jgi:hypothetical protein
VLVWIFAMLRQDSNTDQISQRLGKGNHDYPRRNIVTLILCESAVMLIVVGMEDMLKDMPKLHPTVMFCLCTQNSPEKVR